MTTQIERNGGWVDLTGWSIGQTVKVLSFAGRTKAGPSYFVSCSRCGSRWQELHHKLAQEYKTFKCRNVSCQLGKITKPQDIAPEPEPKPEPIQFQPRTDSEYERYSAYCKRLGLQAGSQSDWANLDDVFKNQLMKPIETAEYAYASGQVHSFGASWIVLNSVHG